MAKKTYIVLRAMSGADGDYARGDERTMDSNDAASLVKLGALKLVPARRAKPAAKAD